MTASRGVSNSESFAIEINESYMRSLSSGKSLAKFISLLDFDSSTVG